MSLYLSFLLIFAGEVLINIEDINDNVPVFIHTKSTFGEFIFEIV